MEKPNASDIEAKRLKLEIELLEELQYVENRLNNRQAAVMSKKEQGLSSAISPNTGKGLRHAVKHFTQFSGEDALPCSSDKLDTGYKAGILQQDIFEYEELLSNIHDQQIE